MDWMAVWLVLMGIGLIVFLIVFAYAAVMRMRGRRTRFDPFIATFMRAQGAAVFPPSLRGDPTPPAIESQEISRGTDASRRSPNEIDPPHN